MENEPPDDFRLNLARSGAAGNPVRMRFACKMRATGVEKDAGSS
jgi:hypothetical protein